MIDATKIRVEINGCDILKGVSATFQAGEVNVIVGPNGAGKSTLMRCLTGALRPSAGRVTLDRRPLRGYDLCELARKRAVLSQSSSISFPFTAEEIVVMGRNPHIAKHPSAKDRQVVDRVLDAMDVYPLKRRVFPTLSGGEQQRVQLARVLAQIWEEERACLFLDEPTTALDLKHQHEVLQLVRNVAMEKEWAVVMIIHDLHLAKRYGDRALLIKDGEIVLSATVDDALVPEHISAVFDVPLELTPM